MIILIYNSIGRKIVTSALKQMRIPHLNANAQEYYVYHSRQQMTLDTGRQNDARFSLSISRERGNQLLNIIEDMVKKQGFEHMMQAGIEPYFD